MTGEPELAIADQPAPGAARGTVVLVHGAWHDARCWEGPFVDELARGGYDVVRFDLRAHGRSGRRKPLRFTTIADYVRDLERVLDRAGGTAFVIGHSMGGAVVQKLLERRRVRGAVLLATVPVHGVWRATLKIARRAPAAFARANLTWSLWPIVADERRARELLYAPDYPPELARRTLAQMQDESYLAFLGMLLDLPQPARNGSDVLVVAAERDGLFAPRELAATARAYRAEYVEVPGAIHMLMAEPGAGEVARRLLPWLDARA